MRRRNSQLDTGDGSKTAGGIVSGLPAVTSKRSKYNAIKTEVDGIVFDSKKEAKRWTELRLLERAGQIHNLERQHRVDVKYNGILLFWWKADFVFFEDGKRIYEDVKSPMTAALPVYRLKKRILKAMLNIDVRET
jgi:hypothetical protein